MSVGYALVNKTRREILSFHRLPVSSASEIARDPVAALLTTSYMLRHLGEAIGFVSDTYGEWPFPEGECGAHARYRDVTDQMVQEMIGEGILRDDGILWRDDDDPGLYIRKIGIVGWRDERKSTD